MKRIVVLASTTVVGIATIVTAVRPAAAGDEFGSQGVIIGIDHALPIISYQSLEQDQTGGGSSTNSRTSFGLVTSDPYGLSGGTTYTTPRLGVDVVIVPHVTLGGSAWIFTDLGVNSSSTPAGGGTSTSTPSAKLTDWGVAPRLGYVIPFNPTVAVWPRGGVAYTNLGLSSVTTTVGGVSSTSPGSGFWQFAFEIDAMLVVTPWTHFGFTIGPTADIPLAGKATSTTSSASSSGPTTTTTTSNNASMLQVGLSAGLLGHF